MFIMYITISIDICIHLRQHSFLTPHPARVAICTQTSVMVFLHIGGGIYDIWYPNPKKIATKGFSTDLISIGCQY